MTAPTFTQPTQAGETPAGAQIKEMLLAFTREAADTPRSRQKQLGLSEYGHPCARRVAMTVAERPRMNDGGDGWGSTLGTWGHAGLTETIRESPNGEGWLLDHPVLLGGMVPGHLDAFFIPEGALVDFKFSGPTTIKEYRRSGPPGEYQSQAHGYGGALAEEGYDVRSVSLAFFPRAYDLSEMWVWSVPFDPSVPERGLRRLEAIYDLLDALGLWEQQNPERWDQVPATPTKSCHFCPFWKPGSTDITRGCPGQGHA